MEEKERKGRDGGHQQTERESVRLTSVSVGGLVKHEHGIIDLGGDKQQFFNAALSLLPRGILPDLSPSQVLQGGSATDGQKGGGRGREGGRGLETSDRLQRGDQGSKDRKIRRKYCTRQTGIMGNMESWKLCLLLNCPGHNPSHREHIIRPLSPLQSLTFPWQLYKKSL